MGPTTALNLLQKQDSIRHLSLGCKIIDKITGGVSCQGITEISGEAGCGKTQICLVLSMQVQLSYECGGLSGQCAYISCGEGQFPIKRLAQLANSFENCKDMKAEKLLSNVHIEQCFNVDEILTILYSRIPLMCKSHNIKLLVIDSIAGLLRFEFDNSKKDDMIRRTCLMFKISQQLKWIADIFGVAVVVVNQVSASIESNNEGNYDFQNDSNSNTPALGLAWSHCVNTRIFLTRNSIDARSIELANQEYDSNFANDDLNGKENNLNASDEIVGSNVSKESVIDNVPHQSFKHSTTPISIIRKRPSSFAALDHNIASLKSSRLLILERSPRFPPKSCSFEINCGGIFGIETTSPTSMDS
eukprot:gene5031-7020_t